MRGDIRARIVLGGRVVGYRGAMPGIAEETSLSLERGQSVFLLGGFGGCARDIAETLGLAERWTGSRDEWDGRLCFRKYSPDDLHNGLSREENVVLARTPHIQEAVALVSRGLRKSPRPMEMKMHKVFISYHHGNDQLYKEKLVEFGERYSLFRGSIRRHGRHPGRVDRSADPSRDQRQVSQGFDGDCCVGRERDEATKTRRFGNSLEHVRRFGEQMIGGGSLQPPGNLRRSIRLRLIGMKKRGYCIRTLILIRGRASMNGRSTSAGIRICLIVSLTIF